jgi:MYXO-CTERM domain-containing protein
VISGAGNSQNGTVTSLYKDGAGVLTLSGNNSYSGDSRITGGTVTVASGGDLGDGTSDVFISSGATLNVNASSEVASLQETGTGNGGVAAIGSGATLTVSGNAYNGFMNSISGEGNLVKSGTGTMNLYGAQTYTGTTTVSGGKLSSAVGIDSSAITVSGGTFETTAANVVANTAAVTVNSGTFSVGGSDAIGAISGSGGTINIASGTLTTSFDAATSTYSGAVTGTGGLTKSGTGTLTLAGNNTKSGTNTVSAGTLVVNGQLAGSTTVQSGATLAGGGSVGATTVGNGATISPGNSPGTLSLTNGFTLGGGGNYNWQIYNATGTAGATNGWDLIAVTGGDWDISGLSSTNQFNINLWSLSGVTPDVNGNALNFNNAVTNSWEILTYASLNGTFNSNLFAINTGPVGPTGGFANDLNGGVFSLEDDGNSLNLLFTPGGGPGPSPVPEPGTWAAAALLAGAAGYVRWRRRKEVEPKA